MTAPTRTDDAAVLLIECVAELYRGLAVITGHTIACNPGAVLEALDMCATTVEIMDRLLPDVLAPQATP